MISMYILRFLVAILMLSWSAVARLIVYAGVRFVSFFFRELYHFCSGDPQVLHPANAVSTNTTLTLAAAHGLVQLEDGVVVGDPMEKVTLKAISWKVDKGVLF